MLTVALQASPKSPRTSVSRPNWRRHPNEGAWNQLEPLHLVALIPGSPSCSVNALWLALQLNKPPLDYCLTAGSSFLEEKSQTLPKSKTAKHSLCSGKLDVDLVGTDGEHSPASCSWEGYASHLTVFLDPFPDTKWPWVPARQFLGDNQHFEMAAIVWV